MIEPHGLTVAAAAKVLGVSRPALSTFLNGRSDLSGIMALRIEKAFGVKMDTLMRMQASYDIARTAAGRGDQRRALSAHRTTSCSAVARLVDQTGEMRIRGDLSQLLETKPGVPPPVPPRSNRR